MPAKPASKLSRAIPAAYHAEVQRLRSEKHPDTGVTWTSTQVAAYLGATHGLRCSRMAVIRLEAALSERGDALLVEALRGQMLAQVGPAAARLVRSSKILARKLGTAKDVGKIASAVRAQATALDTFAKLSGVASPIAVDVTTGGQPLPDAYDALAAALAGATAGAPRGAAGGGDPKPPAGGG